MGDDAPQESQSAQITPRTAEMRAFVAELIRKEIAAERARAQQRIDEIMATAGAPEPPVFHVKQPKRDRHGMHIVRGCVLAGAGACAGYARAHARHLLVATAAGAVLTGSSCLSPDMMQQAPAAQMPGHHVMQHHHQVLPPVPAVAPVNRKRRRLDNDDTVRAGAGTVPAASPSATATLPEPSPAGTPGPLPSILPTPLPSPSPTCLHLDGKNRCHDGGDGDVTGVLGALGSLGRP